jgi:two-component system, chemotaxis family, chemotaxis protein CheY
VKCLIVEDDLTSRKLLETYLADCADCSGAGDGQEAVEAFEEALDFGRPFDLICLDVMMPGMDGHEALTEIRRIEAERNIKGLDGVKVIMTTALDDSTNIFGSFREGCEAYVVKPVVKDKLMTEIEKLGLLTESR